MPPTVGDRAGKDPVTENGTALAFGVGVGASDSSGICHSTLMPGASRLMTIMVRVLVRPLVGLDASDANSVTIGDA